MRRTFCFLYFFALASIQTFAQPGTPITSFGINGIIRPDFGNLTGASTLPHLGNSIIEAPGGKYYTVTEISGMGYISRWNSNGTLDESYGTKGYSRGCRIGFPMGYLQPDGKIIITGFANISGNASDFALARYNSDGSFDHSFGINGKISINMTNGLFTDIINSLVIQNDGKIVVAGFANGNASGDLAFARFNPNGTIDPSFGTGGKVVMSLSAGTDEIQALSLDAAGNIIGVGVMNSGANGDAAIVRLLPNGSLDNSFDGDGKMIVNVQNGDGLYGITIQPDGKLLVGGYSKNGTLDRGLVMRVHPNGTLDNSFDGDGIYLLSISQPTIVVNLRLLNDGRIAGSGMVHTAPTNRDFLLFRLGADGTPDAGFNGNGLVIISNPSDEEINFGSHQMLLQQDGSMVITGWEYLSTPSNLSRTQLELVRYLGDGTADNSFGPSSRVRSYMSQGNVFLTGGIVRQPDGKFLVAGRWNKSTTSTPDFDCVVARYNPDGSADNGFGINGLSVIAVGTGNDLINALILQPDGKIVVGGNGTVSPGNTDFALVRLNSDGTLDASFDGDGKLFISFGSNGETINELILQPDGKIFALGSANLPGSGVDMAFARILPTGALDNSFDGDGRTTKSLSAGTGTDNATTGTLQSDGKIVIAGGYTNAGSKTIVLRLNNNGSLDNSFNGTGWNALNLGAQNEQVGGIAIQGDGKIVVSANTIGNPALNTQAQIAAVRFNSDGSLDVSFNNTGKKLFLINGIPAVSNTLDLQPDGKILIGGRVVSVLNNTDMAFARLLPNGQFDPSFNGGTIVLEAVDGDETIVNLAITGNEVYAAGFGNHPGNIGFISAFSLGKLDIPSSLQVSRPAAQYSDTITFFASLDAGSMASMQPSSGADFYIGSRWVGNAPVQFNSVSQKLEAVLSTTLSEIGATGSVMPGSKMVKAVFTVLPSFNIPDANSSFSILQEDASLIFSGNRFTSTPSTPLQQQVNSSVMLRATVADANDGYPGDIRRGKLRFLLIENGTTTPISTADTDAGGWLDIQQLNTDSTLGTAQLSWPVSLQADQSSNTFTIAIEIGGSSSYYIRNNTADRVVITVSRSGEHFITGGGTLIPQNSSGSHAATPGSVVQFGFHSKYHHNGNKTKGKGEFIFMTNINGAERMFQARIKNIESMGILPSGNNNGAGQFQAKAHLFDVSNGGEGIMIHNNLDLFVNVTDNGEPGSADMISFALYYPNGSLLMSSNWNGSASVEQLLNSGNIHVKGEFQEASRQNPTTVGIPSTIFPLELIYTEGTKALRIKGGTEEQIDLVIWDASGRVLMQKKLAGEKMVFLNPGWTSGVYFASVKQGKMVRNMKFIY